MPFKISISVVLLLFSAFTNDVGIEKVRLCFEQGRLDKNAALNLKKLTSGNSKPLFKAYHGAAFSLLAKHYVNPLSKIESLNNGLKIINEAVVNDATDVEIRFIRFAIEEHIPAIVSFTNHTSADKEMILVNLKKNHPIYDKIKSYMLQSKLVNAEEKKKLN